MQSGVRRLGAVKVLGCSETKVPSHSAFFPQHSDVRSSILEKQISLGECAGPSAGRQWCCDHSLGSNCPLSRSSARAALVTIGIHFSSHKLTWARSVLRAPEPLQTEARCCAPLRRHTVGGLCCSPSRSQHFPRSTRSLPMAFDFPPTFSLPYLHEGK